ncbi:MAG: cupin domain-containing protein [Aestuariibacter sp.]
MVKSITQKVNSPDVSCDLIEDIFNVLRFRGSIFFSSSLAAPWGLALEESSSPRFHINLKGDFFIGVSGSEDAVQVRQGAIVVLPQGDSHWVADQQNRNLIPSHDAGKLCQLAEPLIQRGEISNKLICGIINFDEHVSHPLIEALPHFLHFSQFSHTDPIWLTVRVIEKELQRSGSSSSAVIDRLTEVLFLLLLDNYLKEHNASQGFLAALQNRRVSQALSLLHSRPEHHWTLEELGKQAGMSPSTLQRQFKDTVGVPPMTYLAQWRVLKAHNLIKYSSMPLEDIADETGFANARTLNKAFSRAFKRTPSSLRKGK